MRWSPGRRSENIEDLRGQGGGRRIGLRLGLGGVVLLLVLSVVTGQNFLALLDPGVMSGPPGSPAEPERPYQPAPGEEQLVDFVSFVLDDTQATWGRLLQGYTDAQLVLFRDAVDSGCGTAARQRAEWFRRGFESGDPNACDSFAGSD